MFSAISLGNPAFAHQRTAASSKPARRLARRGAKESDVALQQARLGGKERSEQTSCPDRDERRFVFYKVYSTHCKLTYLLFSMQVTG
jgi:hypothetical protein